MMKDIILSSFVLFIFPLDIRKTTWKAVSNYFSVPENTDNIDSLSASSERMIKKVPLCSDMPKY